MDIPAYKKIAHDFLGEITDSKNGNKTSLPFIIHQIPQSPLVAVNDTFQVMVIGGTVCKSALVVKNQQGLTIRSQIEITQPVFNTEDDFLEFVAKYSDKSVTILAINFAYPLKPIFENGKLDGILLSGTKEHAFSGLHGKKVGETIEKYVQNKLRRSIRVTLVNDTITLLLSGLTKYPWNQLSAGIVGTGLNFAIFLNQHTLVNLESASFNKFTPNKSSLAIDKNSLNPNSALFEKESSGGYLYQHFNIRAKSEKDNFRNISSTEELGSMARSSNPAGQLARDVLEHSAALVACQIAGITQFYEKNMTFVMEGSLFWKGYQYKNTVEKYVKLLIPEYSVKFAKIHNSGILGAARLVS